MQSFAISMECITFVNEILAGVSSHRIATEFHLIASWWCDFRDSAPRDLSHGKD